MVGLDNIKPPVQHCDGVTFRIGGRNGVCHSVRTVNPDGGIGRGGDIYLPVACFNVQPVMHLVGYSLCHVRTDVYLYGFCLTCGGVRRSAILCAEGVFACSRLLGMIGHTVCARCHLDNPSDPLGQFPYKAEQFLLAGFGTPSSKSILHQVYPQA